MKRDTPLEQYHGVIELRKALSVECMLQEEEEEEEEQQCSC